MAYQRCLMCKNQCGILVNQEGDAVKVSANRNHPQAGICGGGQLPLTF